MRKGRSSHHASASSKRLHALLAGLAPRPRQDDPTPQDSCCHSLLVIISVKGLDHEWQCCVDYMLYLPARFTCDMHTQLNENGPHS